MREQILDIMKIIDTAIGPVLVGFLVFFWARIFIIFGIDERRQKRERAKAQR